MAQPATAAEALPGSPKLIRAIGRWSLTAAIINGVIGSSIFGMPAQIAELVGPWSPLAFLLAGIGTLLVVLCFAEVSSRFTEAGGPYLYARDAFGRDVGFQAGWLTFWIRATATAANLNIFAAYLGELVPQAAAGTGRLAVMAVVLLIITAINVAGVRRATWTVNAFTLAKLTPLMILIVIGVPHISGATLASQTTAQVDWAGAILLLAFAYGGFEAPLMAAGEARQPRRDSAFALLVGLTVIATVYMLVQLVVVGVLPRVAGTRAPVAAAFGALLGTGGVVLGSLGAMISVYGYTTGSVLQSPRLLFAMAEQGDLPRVLARVHARFRTPHVAIVLFAALTLALASYGSFTWNATLSAIVRLVTYGLTCLALLVFRRRDADEPGFRLPGAPLIAPAGALFCFGLLATRTFAQAWILLALMGIGWVIGRLSRRRLDR